ncbi:MAG: peptide deformylase [Candidatus Portnoybacteria bacterium CG10_big_fil_rev_8_21_14_0_10_38_18]|uniref:Peptide deformylase n=1 Tax=Candidatus Portnoybacteria bacterium CG10_big_fil_rev_8_21_14_0_10_38_18 TaxID=1974813 RepID=A0A2M8KCJ7_9BACT|nr:MAG: peptide deformylase [Candidatus Portnoybacteria bacterium CG10_big_fil_rev_8_21_14_0_10_38_18]
MILPIEKGENNPILRQKSQPIAEIDESILNLIKDMIETMFKLDGVGLAACQVGKNIQLFVVNPKLSKKYIFINPEIIKISKKTEAMEEGCLSLPNVFIKIKRARSLKIKAIDENGKQFKLKAKDMLARVIQHEIDHLNGKLIVD